jgi:hypothetical protein
LIVLLRKAFAIFSITLPMEIRPSTGGVMASPLIMIAPSNKKAAFSQKKDAALGFMV